MAGTTSTAEQYLYTLIAQIQQRLAALETQHGWGIVNAYGVPAINCGTVPGSNPPRQGLVLFGADGQTPIAVFGQTGAGQYGVEILDGQGNNRVQLGELANGDYGLQVTDGAGQKREVFPVYASSLGGSWTVTNAYPPAPQAGTPAITAWLGSSGDALVTVSAFIQTFGGGVQGGCAISLNVDGVLSDNFVELIATTGDTACVSNTQLISQTDLGGTLGTLSPNTTHSFGLEFFAPVGTAVVDNLALVVQPI